MTDTEIKRSIDRVLEQLQAEAAALQLERNRFEHLADLYLKQLQEMTGERNRLRTGVNELESMRWPNPACQLC